MKSRWVGIAKSVVILVQALLMMWSAREYGQVRVLLYQAIEAAHHWEMIALRCQATNSLLAAGCEKNVPAVPSLGDHTAPLVTRALDEPPALPLCLPAR